MRTGADYRDTLRRDGRKVWVFGEGLVEDVTTHPATAAVVEEYVTWYDRHSDPAWRDVLVAPQSAEREATAWAYLLPKSSDDLVGMGRSFAKTLFLSAGNLTHEIAATTAPIERGSHDEIGDLEEAVEGIRADTATSIDRYNEMREQTASMLRDIAAGSEVVATASERVVVTTEQTSSAVTEIGRASCRERV